MKYSLKGGGSILYEIDHEYIDGEIGYTNVFGLVETRDEAKKLVDRLKAHTRIGKKYPDGFTINKCRVDLMTSWSEVFTKE